MFVKACPAAVLTGHFSSLLSYHKQLYGGSTNTAERKYCKWFCVVWYSLKVIKKTINLCCQGDLLINVSRQLC